MPTGGERLVWGMGDGSGPHRLRHPVRLPGGLICWENYMPLARAALYGAGIDIYLAPTWDNSDVWVPTLRHIAKEGRVYVVGVASCIRGSDVPADLPGRDEMYGGADDWLSRGNTTIVGPDGEILAGPLVEEEGILYAELDAQVARTARQHFDPAGHYARPDVFHLEVDRRPKPWVGPAPTPPENPRAAESVESAEAAADLLLVLGEVAADHGELELAQDAAGRLPLEEEHERLLDEGGLVDALQAEVVDHGGRHPDHVLGGGRALAHDHLEDARAGDGDGDVGAAHEWPPTGWWPTQNSLPSGSRNVAHVTPHSS